MEYPWERLRIKATKGEVIARHNFALMYFKGEGGLIQSDEEAANWWRKDIEQGYPPSQFNIDLMYFQGRGVKVDCVQALRWWCMAGESGHQGTQFRLGCAHYFGQGTSKGFDEAAKWVLLAAEQGNVRAQYRLGLMYLKGEGVPRDLYEAYIWLNLAAASHDDAKRERDDLGGQLSPYVKQLAERRSSALHKKIRLRNRAQGVQEDQARAPDGMRFLRLAHGGTTRLG